MTLIDADALLDILRSEKGSAILEHSTLMFLRLKGLIAEQPTIDPESLRPKGEWISVEDRLPEKDRDVLCSRGNHIEALMGIYSYIGENKWEDPYGNWNYGDLEGIAHWMPLPDPPDMRGESE